MPEKTLIIFVKVQDCCKVINSMKYFCENAPQYHIACTGFLLGIALAKPSSSLLYAVYRRLRNVKTRIITGFFLL